MLKDKIIVIVNTGKELLKEEFYFSHDSLSFIARTLQVSQFNVHDYKVLNSDKFQVYRYEGITVNVELLSKAEQIDFEIKQKQSELEEVEATLKEIQKLKEKFESQIECLLKRKNNIKN